MLSFGQRSTSVAVLVGLSASFSFAQDPKAEAPAPPPPPPWTGAAQVSFLSTAGNTDTNVLGVGGEARYKGASPWSVGVKSALNRGSVSGKQNLSNFVAALRAGRALDERTELFIETGYAKDTYAGIDSRYGGEAGVARKLSITEPHLLSVEAGVGFAHEVRLPKKTARDFATARAGLAYKYVISKTADFQDQSNVTLNLSDGKDWRWTNVAALTATVSSRFSIKVSHTLSRLNTPPAGKKKSDTAVAAALVAKF